MQLLKELLLETVNTAWVYKKVWPTFYNSLYFRLLPIVDSLQAPLSALPSTIESTILPSVSSKITDSIKDHYRSSSKDKWIDHAKFTLVINKGTYYEGLFEEYDSMMVIIGDQFMLSIINKLYVDLHDEDTDPKANFIKNCLPLMEGLVHEMTHLMQRFSSPLDHNRTYKTLVTKGNKGISRTKYPDEKTGKIFGKTVDYTRYIGFTHEIESFGAAAASSLIHLFVGNTNQSNKEAWNKKVDTAIKYLGSNTTDVHKLSSNFNSVYSGIKKAVSLNKRLPGKFKQQELDKLWKRFLKSTYTHLQSYKL